MSTLKELVEQYKITFEDGDINHDALYKLWTTGEMFDTENSSGLELNYVGLYYERVKPQRGLMKQYYLMAIERGNSDAMNNLGWYYHKKEVDPELMKRYYLMAIERGNSDAMYNLGHYYESVEKNPELMKRYYLMAIERGDSFATGCLLNYYNDYITAEYTEAILNSYKFEKYKSWKMFWKAVINIDLPITPELIEHLTNIKDEHLQTLPKFIQSFAKLAREKIDTLELHFKYAPGAAGYEECKTDFYKSINNS